MIHPMVRHECEEFFKVHRDAPVAFAEIPLLLEGNWHKDGHVDFVAGVKCPDTKRTGELREARGMSNEVLATFDSWQWPEEEKLKQCDIVLRNDKGLDALKAEAKMLQEKTAEILQQRDDEFSRWLEDLWPRLAEEFDQLAESST